MQMYICNAEFMCALPETENLFNFTLITGGRACQTSHKVLKSGPARGTVHSEIACCLYPIISNSFQIRYIFDEIYSVYLTFR